MSVAYRTEEALAPEYVKSARQAITKQQAKGQKSRQSPGRQFTERTPNGREPHRNVPGLIANREACLSRVNPDAAAGWAKRPRRQGQQWEEGSLQTLGASWEGRSARRSSNVESTPTPVHPQAVEA